MEHQGQGDWPDREDVADQHARLLEKAERISWPTSVHVSNRHKENQSWDVSRILYVQGGTSSVPWIDRSRILLVKEVFPANDLTISFSVILVDSIHFGACYF